MQSPQFVVLRTKKVSLAIEKLLELLDGQPSLAELFGQELFQAEQQLEREPTFWGEPAYLHSNPKSRTPGIVCTGSMSTFSIRYVVYRERTKPDGVSPGIVIINHFRPKLIS
jgi:hypothetical protein